jgi:hypothetical protein
MLRFSHVSLAYLLLLTGINSCLCAYAHEKNCLWVREAAHAICTIIVRRCLLPLVVAVLLNFSADSSFLGRSPVHPIKFSAVLKGRHIAPCFGYNYHCRYMAHARQCGQYELSLSTETVVVENSFTVE